VVAVKVYAILICPAGAILGRWEFARFNQALTFGLPLASARGVVPQR